jgi:glycine/D-amino acid oxidase-like deaminating enzyme
VPDAAGNQTVASLAHGSRGAVTAPWAAELLVRAACGEPLPLSIDYWQRLVPGRA